MDNREYISSRVFDEQLRHTLLAAMELYGENHWWESTDPRERAYYQTIEGHQKSGLWFIDFNQFRQDLVALLGRQVYSHEFFTQDATPLIQEVERAWRWNVGVTSETERDRRLKDGLLQLEQKQEGPKILYLETEPLQNHLEEN